MPLQLSTKSMPNNRLIKYALNVIRLSAKFPLLDRNETSDIVHRAHDAAYQAFVVLALRDS